MREYLQQSIATHLEIMEVLRSQAGIERDVYRRMKLEQGLIESNRETVELTFRADFYQAEADATTGALPVTSDYRDVAEVFSGKDLITGRRLTRWEWGATVVGAALPLISGRVLRRGGKSVKAAGESTSDATTAAARSADDVPVRSAPLHVAPTPDVQDARGVVELQEKVARGTATDAEESIARQIEFHDTAGRAKVAPKSFRAPASRHTLSRVNQRTVAKDLNSVVELGVDVAGDVRLINQGQATKVGDTYVVNGRTYGVHDGTLFPISGPGVHQLNRPAFKALGIFNQFGNTAKARQILENMARTNPALNQEAIDAALRAWRAGGGA
ncbi:hypothetical protein Mal4_39400 [Maioricimonas rarisocia]|uniref:Pre-toxin TG domain-containing protein n=1 Tax=Maioricimonas rarisocia TaxID=2528026 RepID=A0A517ZAS6_9PLAN|nr:pre-toxin TG domain-containing protein [Maioricimonas rarisocia]QDU39594.1 hypothetical protein Mal4_39400 [Maioricimonas rarisocia]